MAVPATPEAVAEADERIDDVADGARSYAYGVA